MDLKSSCNDKVLIFIDEKNNFESEKNRIPQSLYKQVLNWSFEEFNSLKFFLEDEENQNLDIILFIHIFRGEDYKGYNHGIKNDLEAEFPNLPLYFVTRDRPGLASDDIGRKSVFKYDEIPYAIRDKKICETKVLNIKANISTSIMKSSDNPYIFISHSSKDKDIIQSFFDTVLRLGLNIHTANIFYSGDTSTGITPGEYIPDKLKEALSKMTLFIQYISDDYKKSEICLNEMGAAWLKLPKEKIIILKAPNLPFENMGFLNIQRIGLSINNKYDILQLANQYKMLFDFHLATLDAKIDEFILKNNF